MKFVLEIKMDGAAFHDAAGDDDDETDMANSFAAGSEVGRILRDLAMKVEEQGLPAASTGVQGALMDYNGNRVGAWGVTS